MFRICWKVSWIVECSKCFCFIFLAVCSYSTSCLASNAVQLAGISDHLADAFNCYLNPNSPTAYAQRVTGCSVMHDIESLWKVAHLHCWSLQLQALETSHSNQGHCDGSLGKPRKPPLSFAMCQIIILLDFPRKQDCLQEDCVTPDCLAASAKGLLKDSTEILYIQTLLQWFREGAKGYIRQFSCPLAVCFKQGVCISLASSGLRRTSRWFD